MTASVRTLRNTLLMGACVAPFYFLTGPAAAQNNNSNETVVVTGTRVQGMTAADSAAPITVLGSSALTQASGSSDLRLALGQTVPSFTAESSGSDLARLTLTAALRGLSANDTLVLVNSKRRHGTGNLNVSSGAGFAGGAAPDISLIPTAGIDHIEVLQDGAAAQYGTDAIAGVVNIILKKKSSGGTFSATAGKYYRGDGDTYDVSLNIGFPLFDKGYLDLTLDKKYFGFTHMGGPDSRVITADGATVPTGTVSATPNANGVITCTGGNCIPLSTLQSMPDYPRINHQFSAAEMQLATALVNLGYDFSDTVQFYGFGTYGHRFAKANQNVRLPNQVIAAPGSNQPCSAANRQGYFTAQTAAGAPACALGVGGGVSPIAGTTFNTGGLPTGLNSNGQVISSGQAGTLFTPGEVVFAPLGFTPQEVIREDDYQYNLGLKLNVAGWDVDIAGSYGKDIDNIYTWNSGNRALFIDTHTSPRDFYDGTFMAAELVGNVDATRQFNVGLAGPLNVAVGLEAREDVYQIKAGDAASTYKEGPQAFPGFQNSDSGIYSRKNYAAYMDFAFAPIEELQIDIAGRVEHYSDFGDTQIGKVTARYDFSPALAIRGTISTGFRAPTLAEEFYSATKVTPTAATVQLPANSAAAKILGLPNLGPEISTQYSAGIVAHPLDDLSITLDAYSVTLGDRIVRSSTLFSLGGAINSPLVNDAIRAHGNVLDPTATQNGVTVFLNGLDSLTQGVDLTVSYLSDFNEYGLVNWTLAGNYNQTSVSGVSPVPPEITASSPGATLFPAYALANFVHNAPQEKIGLNISWSLDEWGLTIRETYYGPIHTIATPNGGPPLYAQNQAGVGLFDLEARYNLTEQLQFALGGNNMFNVKPNTNPLITNTPDPSTGGGRFVTGVGGVLGSPISAPFDPNGGYYYGRLTYNF
ncbi:MAG: TonB-dependent receptor [Alphaproteobacteria bacterium]|nr:TonB-dependent receptor [Alphaproteobacteria bacterium]